MTRSHLSHCFVNLCFGVLDEMSLVQYVPIPMWNNLLQQQVVLPVCTIRHNQHQMFYTITTTTTTIVAAVAVA